MTDKTQALEEARDKIVELCHAFGVPLPEATLDRINAALRKKGVSESSLRVLSQDYADMMQRAIQWNAAMLDWAKRCHVSSDEDRKLAREQGRTSTELFNEAADLRKELSAVRHARETALDRCIELEEQTKELKADNDRLCREVDRLIQDKRKLQAKCNKYAMSDTHHRERLEKQVRQVKSMGAELERMELRLTIAFAEIGRSIVDQREADIHEQ